MYVEYKPLSIQNEDIAWSDNYVLIKTVAYTVSLRVTVNALTWGFIRCKGNLCNLNRFKMTSYVRVLKMRKVTKI